MLTGLDEALLHQAPLPFSATTASDHRFYDRCWVAAYNPLGGTALNMGLGVYKNMNVADGFVCCVHDRKQRNVRVSRQLRPAIDEPCVGPLRYEVLEPYRHVRVELEETGGLACRLDWRGLFEPIVEDRAVTEINGRIAADVQRYDQVGRVDGWIKFGEERVLVEQWFGARDHSWGVRGGVGGFEPPNGTSPYATGLLVTWLLFATDDLTGYAQLTRDGTGRVVFRDGLLRWRDERGDRSVAEIDQDIEFPQDSRFYRRATLRLVDSEGESHNVACERLTEPIVMRGAGYDNGYADGRGLGVHRGSHLIEHDEYDLSIEGRPRLVSDGVLVAGLQREQPVSVMFDGSAGTGDFTVLTLGALPGFAGASGAS
ncbi:MAG: hypothetical protein ACRDKS_10025 [Actinomycetota bacterium]